MRAAAISSSGAFGVPLACRARRSGSRFKSCGARRYRGPVAGPTAVCYDCRNAKGKRLVRKSHHGGQAGEGLLCCGLVCEFASLAGHAGNLYRSALS